MTNTVSITFELNTTDANAQLGFEAWVDDIKFIDLDYVQGWQLIKIDMPDTDGDHELQLVLKGKTEAHTQIDEQGTIVSDVRLTINDLSFDEIKLGYMLTELATYTHDFNGTKEPTKEKFYGEIGCNGTVSLKFTTPVYLWLLENM
jgi:hypothetical protein